MCAVVVVNVEPSFENSFFVKMTIYIEVLAVAVAVTGSVFANGQMIIMADRRKKDVFR